MMRSNTTTAKPSPLRRVFSKKKSLKEPNKADSPSPKESRSSSISEQENQPVPETVTFIAQENAANLDGIPYPGLASSARTTSGRFTSEALDIAIADRHRTRQFIMRLAGCQALGREETDVNEAVFHWSKEPPSELLVERLESVQETDRDAAGDGTEEMDKESLGAGADALSDDGGVLENAKARNPDLPFSFASAVDATIRAERLKEARERDLHQAREELAAFQQLSA